MTGSGSGYIALELEENEFNTKVEGAKKLANEYGLKVRSLEIIKELSLRNLPITQFIYSTKAPIRSVTNSCVLRTL